MASGLVLSGPTALVLDRIGDARQLMSGVELTRADAIRSEYDRADFLAAHALVRVCAGRLLGLPPARLTLVQSCDSCPRPHGRPELAEAPWLTVSLSHTQGHVAAAAADGPIGVDIEVTDDDPLDWRVAEFASSAPELDALRRVARPRRSFIRQWVRKEALVKVGVTTLDQMSAVDLPVTDRSPVRWQGWRLDDWSDPGGLALGCVASQGTVTVEVFN